MELTIPFVFLFSVQDSMGSFPDSGVLLGRVYSLGSYDECLQIKPTYQSVYEQNATGEMKLAGVHDFDMHYCLTKWYLTNVEVSVSLRMLQTYIPIKSFCY